MLCLRITPKKQNQNENQPSLILNSGNLINENYKKFKKNLKNRKTHTAFIISKKMNHFFKKIKSKKEKLQKMNNDNLIKNGIKNNDYRNFLYYKLKKKYNSENFSYNVKKINELIFNIPSKFTACFKDFLLIEEDAEFLKREYKKKEFEKKFKKIFYFYEKYSKTFPNYTIINEGKYMYKNILKKQKMIDELQKMKEEEEERTNSKIMDISSETIFTSNTMESIINQKDSFWLKNLEDIIYLDNKDETNYFENIELIINNIDLIEKLNFEKSNKQIIYKKEFKKIRNLSKPLYINQINPKLIEIKEKINKIKNYRNNFNLKKSKNNKTIESTYNSFSTTLNNKSFNKKANLINTNSKNLYEEKKEIFKKRIPCPKDLSYKKINKERRFEIDRLINISNKFKKNAYDRSQNDSRISNSMIANKIKNYFKININHNDKKKQIINSQKKGEYSYNIGSLFNSRKDRGKEFLTDKKLVSVFNKYINNRTKPFKKRQYLISETDISQNNINNYHNKNDFMIISQNNLNHNTYNIDNCDSKRSFDDNNNNKSNKKNNFNLNKNNINININISQNSFLNHTFSSMIKYNKKDFNLNRNNMSKKFKKNLEHMNKNKLILKSKILKHHKSKTNAKSIAFLNGPNKAKNLGDKNHLKAFYNIKTTTSYSINNTNLSIGNKSSINQKRKTFKGKKIVLSGGHYGRNDKFINLKFAFGNTFHSNKNERKKILLNK